MTKRVSLQTSQEIRAHLLCRGCELLFNRNGEDWVLANGYRGKDSYRLYDPLKNAEPLNALTSNAHILAGATLPEINIERLVYFASSVFWRAAAHTWQLIDHQKRLDFGPYEEELRLYLLGHRDFPTNGVIWVSVSSARNPFITMCFPYGGKKEGGHQYRFTIPGIAFDLFLGKQIPEMIRRMCTLRSPEGFLYFTPVLDDNVTQDMVKAYGASRTVGKLASLRRPRPAIHSDT